MLLVAAFQKFVEDPHWLVCGDLFVGCGSNFRRERAKAVVVAVTKAVRDAGVR